MPFMIPIDLDIDMLRCFVEVVNAKSFTKAGNNIGLTQSGVSIKIRRLEDRLDMKLFNRPSKTLSLTIDGEMLLEYAKRILALHDEAVTRLTTPKASGKLRVGLIDYFIPEILPNLLNKFRKQYPNIQLQVRTDVGMNLVPMYERGELDMVVAGAGEYKGESRTIRQEPLVWVIGKDSDISVHEHINLALLPAPCGFRKLATEGVESIGKKWDIPFTGTSIANIQAAVQAGIGISVLPSGAVTGGMQKVPSKWNLPELPIYSIIMVSDETKKNNAKDYFINYLESELNQLQLTFK